jgi:hypothetical protein
LPQPALPVSVAIEQLLKCIARGDASWNKVGGPAYNKDLVSAYRSEVNGLEFQKRLFAACIEGYLTTETPFPFNKSHGSLPAISHDHYLHRKELALTFVRDVGGDNAMKRMAINSVMASTTRSKRKAAEEEVEAVAVVASAATSSIGSGSSISNHSQSISLMRRRHRVEEAPLSSASSSSSSSSVMVASSASSAVASASSAAVPSVVPRVVVDSEEDSEEDDDSAE